MDKVHSLSEAMRLGASLRPQCQGNYYINNRSCAIGAAAEAIGVGSVNDWSGTMHWNKLERRFPELHRNTHCPVDCCPERRELFGIIAHLNDDHRWTRERIASWLEGQGL